MTTQLGMHKFDVMLVKSIGKFNAAKFVYPKDGSGTARYTSGIISIQIQPDRKNPDTMVFATLRFTAPGMGQEYSRHVKIMFSGQPHNGRAFNRLGVVVMPYANHRTDHVCLIFTPDRKLNP